LNSCMIVVAISSIDFAVEFAQRMPSLDISFSGEVGNRKGSWKGGTVGHSTNMRHDETHKTAFQRYCVENGMTFVPERVMARVGDTSLIIVK